MCMSDDCVPLKNVKSPYGGGVSPLPGAAGGPPPAMFPVAPALLVDEYQLGSWQVAVVRVDETPAGDSSEQDSPCDTHNRHRPMDMDDLPNSLAHTVVQGGPVGPQGIEPLALLVHNHAVPAGQHAVIQNSLLGPAGPIVKEPLALLVFDHADPAGQHAATQSTTSLWERLPAQPEPSRGGGLVERISDEEPTVHQVSGTALDSQLMEGITYLEHPAQGVSLDSGPMEGSSCLEPVKQSILRSLQTERPRIGDRLVKGISDGEPTVCQVPGTALDSQLMEGTTYLEHLALGVSLDSGPMEGSSCIEPVEQSILLSSWTVSPRNCVIKQKSEWKLVITPAISYTLDSRPMEGMTYLERPTPGVSLDSWLMEGASCLKPLEQLVLSSSIAARCVEDVIRKVSDRKPVINQKIYV